MLQASVMIGSGLAVLPVLAAVSAGAAQHQPVQAPDPTGMTLLGAGLVAIGLVRHLRALRRERATG
jgi:hypothetical protein